MSDSNHIGWAVYKLKLGYQVRRRAWPKFHCIEMAPRAGIQWLPPQMIIMFSGMARSTGAYTCTQDDLLADDWELH